MAMPEFRNRFESGVELETEDWATKTIGAALEVFAKLGPGLPEVAYRESMSHQLTLRGIPHRCKTPVPIFYKGKLVAESKVDILVAEVLVVELKVVDALGRGPNNSSRFLPLSLTL